MVIKTYIVLFQRRCFGFNFFTYGLHELYSLAHEIFQDIS